MTPLERADLHAAIETRYPDNTTEDITPKDLRDGLHELVDSVFVTKTDTGAVPNVPEYKAGTFYAVGYTVRYTPLGGSEGFYAAKTAGKHTAPGPGNLIDWKVVPGPVTPTALSQSLTLSQAQGLDQAGVVAGREYLIDCGPDANGNTRTITVRGIANDFYDVAGTLEVAGVRTAITDFKVQAGTWREATGVTDTQLEKVRTTVGLSAAVSANYTLALSDAGNIVPVTAAVSITVPLHSTVSFPVGAVLELVATTPALFTVQAASGVTVLAATGNLAAGQGIPIRLVQLAIDSWLLTGGSV